MKFCGKKIDMRGAGTVKIPRNGEIHEIKVKTFPLFFDMDNYVVLPEEPVSPKRDKSGKIIRDENDKPELLPDRTPEFTREFDHACTLRNVVAFYFAVNGCGQFEFEGAPGKKPEDGEPFFEAIANELNEAGFTPGDVAEVGNFTRRLSFMAGQGVEDYIADFFPGEKSRQNTDPVAESETAPTPEQ